MNVKSSFRAVNSALLVFFLVSNYIYAQSTSSLTNMDIVVMVKERISANLIKAKINSSTTNFDTSTEALQQLKKLGVPEAIIVAMIERQSKQSAQSEAAATPDSPPQAPQPQTAANLAPKRPGIPRIGIVTTTTTAPLEQDEAIRAQIYEVLYGNRETSSAEAILMREKLDKNIATEAIFTKCDYLLFISLESTIESAVEKKGNFLQRTIKAGAEGLGAATKMASPIGMLSGITYKSYQMADSLQTSTTLLHTIAAATEKNDKIGINFRLVKVGNNESLIPLSLKEIIAKKKREPILQNLLIQLGNDIVNVIPSGASVPVKIP